MSNANRILVHFSCGAASAVAAKVAVERYGREADVQVVYCDLSSDEHPDNARFLADIEKWVGRTVIKLANPKYKSVNDVFGGVRYMVGPHGAACTRVMKREVREAYQREGDRHVIGYTADEKKRIATFKLNNPELDCLWILVSAGITKSDCYHILSSQGIELPAMYRLGYDHNNCIGCVKGGKGYWNKIRRDFPDVFKLRAEQQRDIGCAFRSGGDLFWLDELGESEGNDVAEPDIECGVFCTRYGDLLRDASESKGKK